MTDEEKLLALASKVENISDVDSLASAFVDWLMLCPEAEGFIDVLHKCAIRNS